MVKATEVAVLPQPNIKKQLEYVGTLVCCRLLRRRLLFTLLYLRTIMYHPNMASHNCDLHVPLRGLEADACWMSIRRNKPMAATSNPPINGLALAVQELYDGVAAVHFQHCITIFLSCRALHSEGRCFHTSRFFFGGRKLWGTEIYPQEITSFPLLCWWLKLSPEIAKHIISIIYRMNSKSKSLGPPNRGWCSSSDLLEVLRWRKCCASC